MTDNGIKTLRMKIDGIAWALRSDGPHSRPVALAATSLEVGRMWLGESLAELGRTTPYADSMDPTNENIAPETDTDPSGDNPYMPPDGSTVKFIKELRVTLARETDKVRQEIADGESSKKFYQLAMRRAYTALCEGRMWLGKELDRIHQSGSD